VCPHYTATHVEAERSCPTTTDLTTTETEQRPRGRVGGIYGNIPSQGVGDGQQCHTIARDTSWGVVVMKGRLPRVWLVPGYGGRPGYSIGNSRRWRRRRAGVRRG
jgi:hypothetical protein